GRNVWNPAAARFWTTKACWTSRSWDEPDDASFRSAIGIPLLWKRLMSMLGPRRDEPAPRAFDVVQHKHSSWRRRRPLPGKRRKSPPVRDSEPSLEPTGKSPAASDREEVQDVGPAGHRAEDSPRTLSPPRRASVAPGRKDVAPLARAAEGVGELTHRLTPS